MSNLDSYNMKEDLLKLPEQLLYTCQELSSTSCPIDSQKIQSVVVCGMGGSAIGADIVKAIYADALAIPIETIRDYTLPQYCNDHTLVICCSYSGNTEETLSCFEQAIKKKTLVIALTSGGILEKKAKEHSIPLFKITYQSQCGQPRVNVGVMTTALIIMLCKANILKQYPQEQFDETVEVIKQCSKLYTQDDQTNPALELAKKMLESMPILHASGFLSPVALRIKQDSNETGKHVACVELLPECNHNAVVGYEFPKQVNNKSLMIALRSNDDHPRIKLRWEVMRALWEKNKFPYISLQTTGNSKLAQVFSLITLGMWTSYYVALLEEVDPTPVEVISFLKKSLQ